MTAEKVDVLICGSGSAGLCAATWFAKRGLNCKVLESRHGPLLRGQADGVQCRTVEIFQSFGLSEVLLRDSYHVLETTFWSRTGGRNGIVRLGRTADTQPGLSHQPHVIYNQALLNGLLLNAMQKFNGQGVEYGVTVKQVEVDESTVKDPKAFCVKVLAEKNGSEVEFNARYVLVRFIIYSRLALPLRTPELIAINRAVTVPTARYGNRSVSRWSVTAPITSGESWMFMHSLISPMCAEKSPSRRISGVCSSFHVKAAH